MANQPTVRVPVIDGLRGSAILLVLFYHVWSRSGFQFNLSLFGRHFDLHTFIQGGLLGVEIFFFVSGFCLMLPYAGYVAGRRDFQSWKEYVSRRFWKIVPSYYLALAILAAGFPFDATQGLNRFYDAGMHALFLHSFDPRTFSSINSNFWSLAVEVQFYGLFPLIVGGFLRKPLIALSAVVGAGLLYSNYIAAAAKDVWFSWAYQLPSFLPLFALGMACAYVHERWIASSELSEDLRGQMSAVAIVSVFALAYLFEQMDRVSGGYQTWMWQNGHRLEIGAVLSIFTLSAVCSKQWLQEVVANDILTFYSDISYNMYLWNEAVVVFITRKWNGHPQDAAYLFFAMCTLATTGAGWIVTRLWERPLMRLRWNAPRRLFETLRLLPRQPSAANTSSAWPATETFGHTLTSVPSLSNKNVERVDVSNAS